jgi:hypothetical protein
MLTPTTYHDYYKLTAATSMDSLNLSLVRIIFLKGLIFRARSARKINPFRKTIQSIADWKNKKEAAMIWISITRLRLRSVRFLPKFLWLSWQSTRQAKKAEGNRRLKLEGGKGLVFWTLTAWDNEALMRAYMSSGAHRHAMPKLIHWCNEASTVHWLQETDELPSMAEAYRRMQAEGRFYKVNYPSADQEAHQIAESRTQ